MCAWCVCDFSQVIACFWYLFNLVSVFLPFHMMNKVVCFIPEFDKQSQQRDAGLTPFFDDSDNIVAQSWPWVMGHGSHESSVKCLLSRGSLVILSDHFLF